MRNICIKKVLVVGIIVLFISMVFVTYASSRRNISPAQMLYEHVMGSKDIEEIVSSDILIEVITFISGDGYIDYLSGIIFQHVYVYNARIFMLVVSLNFIPLPVFASGFEAYRFLGVFLGIAEGYGGIFGIAIGEIDWWL